MTSLWIVHREEALRRALARLTGSSERPVLGGPGDAFFEEAPAPDVVLMGLGGDLERELEFAHRLARRRRHTGWILVGERGDLERGRRLFDNLPAAFLPYPPDPAALRSSLRALSARSSADPLPLSQRPARDALSERFARGFSDLELPELLRALDPRMAEVPVLVLGEPGTGRSTLARYLHHFGGNAGGALVELRCAETTSAEELNAGLESSRLDPRSRRACSLWLADVERLPAALQREVAGWVELGPPGGSVCTDVVRWIGTAREEGLDPELRRALGTLTIHIPPLRERPELLASLASETLRAWCAARSVPTRRLGEDALAALEEYPWPGNLRELEAVLEQSLAASAADPLGAEDLVLDGEPFAPLREGVLETRLMGEPERPARREPRLEVLPAVEAVPDLDAELALEALEEPEPAQLVEEPQREAAGAAEEKEEEPEEEPPAPAPPISTPGQLTRLVAAVGHELRNPLTAVRALAELLPEHYAEPEFRARFARVAGEGLNRVEDALDHLDRLAAFAAPEREPIDVGGLLEEVLDKRRGRIHERRLLVLEELDRARPRALCDPEQLRFAFEALLDAAIDLVPERGHVYLASKRNTAGLGGGPSVRVLLRFRGPQVGPVGPQHTQLEPAANALDVALAEIAVSAQGGTLTVDTSDRSETVIVVDLPS
jgi:DNA-binding NtrC family response regulator